MRLIGIAIIVLATVVGLYYMGWLNPEAEQRVEKGLDSLEETGILDKSIREISDSTIESVRGVLDSLSESELKALLDKVEESELDLDEVNADILKEMINEKLSE